MRGSPADVQLYYRLSYCSDFPSLSIHVYAHLPCLQCHQVSNSVPCFTFIITSPRSLVPYAFRSHMGRAGDETTSHPSTPPSHTHTLSLSCWVVPIYECFRKHSHEDNFFVFSSLY